MTAVSNTYSISINASPEAVYDYVSDLTRHPEWNEELVIEAQTPGPVQVGSHYHSWGWGVKREGPANEIEITELDRPSHFAFAASDQRFGKVTHRFTFTPEGGGTLVERTTSADFPTPVAVLWRLGLQRALAQPRMEQSFAALKAKLENRKE